jgi:hypothetical protein
LITRGIASSAPQFVFMIFKLLLCLSSAKNCATALLNLTTAAFAAAPCLDLRVGNGKSAS